MQTKQATCVTIVLLRLRLCDDLVHRLLHEILHHELVGIPSAVERLYLLRQVLPLGLVRLIRQPIYVGFALTLWTVPVWTPDQLALALSLTAYCLIAPRLKERRFATRYGARFDRYRARVPYVIPCRRQDDAQ